ncbi:hypothetical protein PRZ48_005627 [Zasmidium cellare]|uniref:Uncharacterized protein n=1 Tax=Zasmidium cellare TaxID=395010 RepID=A0ABR0EKV8_ZASCE|nr:hypothetical protein PRZ48_005627 [Zasmidium cellare]
MPADMSKIPADVEAGPLVGSKVEAGLQEVKQRLENACSQYQELHKRYNALPEEQQQEEDLHAEFASFPGMYDGVLGVIGESVAEAAAEQERAETENCFESLRGAMEFLAPVERKFTEYETAIKAQEQTAKQPESNKEQKDEKKDGEKEIEKESEKVDEKLMEQKDKTTDKVKKSKRAGKKKGKR